MTTKKIVIGAGLIGLGYYVYKTVDNLPNQIVIGSPKIVGLRGTKLLLQLPIQNLSTFSLPFTSFNGLINILVNLSNGTQQTKQLATVVIAPEQKIQLAARKTTTVTVECSLNIAVIIGELYTVIFTNFNWKKLTETYGAKLVGNGFSGIIKIPVNQTLI